MDGQGEVAQAVAEAATPQTSENTGADRAGELERELEQTRSLLKAEQRGRSVDRELLVGGVLDLAAARDLVEKELERTPDLKRAVAKVRQQSPALFRRVMPAIAGATRARSGSSNGVGAELESAQRAALESGDRKALLRYLRLRREE